MPVSCLHMQGTDLSPLNALTQLTWLSLSANLDDAGLASLRLGANMMVCLRARRNGIEHSIFTPAIDSVLTEQGRVCEPPMHGGS